MSASFLGNAPADSGISSTEELNGHLQYSTSAGNSPSHPPVGAAAICHPGRLTKEQCKYAEQAAQAMVARELAGIPQPKVQA